MTENLKEKLNEKFESLNKLIEEVETDVRNNGREMKVSYDKMKKTYESLHENYVRKYEERQEVIESLNKELGSTIDESIKDKTLDVLYGECRNLIKLICNGQGAMMYDHRLFINKLLELRRKITEMRLIFVDSKNNLKFEIDAQSQQYIEQGIARTPAEKQAKMDFLEKQTGITKMEIKLNGMESERHTMHRHLTANQTELEKTDVLIDKQN